MNTSPRFLSVCVLVVVAACASAASSSAQVSSKPKDEVLPSLSQIQASLKREPGNAKLYIQLGQVYWAAEDYQNAFEALKQAVKLAPASAEAHNWMGACSHQPGIGAGQER